MQSTDMNILLALDVLLREESVKIAAEKLGLSEPAMSRTLMRARKLLGDPILVRAGRRLVPTPRALELKGRIQALADEARSITHSQRAVSLAEMERTFTIRSDESLSGVFATRIMERLNQTAPKMRLRFLGRPDESTEPLREGSSDLEIVARSMPGPEIKMQLLHHVRHVGAVQAGHSLAREKITPARFATHRHIAAGRMGKPRGTNRFCARETRPESNHWVVGTLVPSCSGGGGNLGSCCVSTPNTSPRRLSLSSVCTFSVSR